MLKAYEYRLYPTEEQETFFAKHFGATRWIYNHFLNVCISSYSVTKKKLSRFELSNQLPRLKQQHLWLKEINSQSLQDSLIHLDLAYQRFFKLKKDFPKFKSKHASKQVFTIPQNLEVDFNQGLITLPKFKQGIKTIFHRRFIGTIRTCTIKKSNTHKYFVSILVDDGIITPIKPVPSIDNAIGIDVGIKTFAVTSNAEVIDNPKYFNSSLHRFKRLQQSLSHKKKGSKNHLKAKIKLTLVHEHVKNQRKDFLHKTSTNLVRENQTLCIEDLNIKGLLRNHKLARHIQDLGLGMFFLYLEYKCNWYGKNLLTIGRFEASSKTCSICGGLNKDLTLADRTWTCKDCGTIHDRDFNASVNIRNFAFVALRNQREVKPIRYEAMELQSRKNSCEAIHSSLDSKERSLRIYSW